MLRCLRPLALPLLVLGMMLGAVQEVSAAEDEVVYFQITFRGITVARASLAASESATGYAVAMRAQSTGLAALFREAGLEMQSQGSVRNGVFLPRAHQGSLNTGRRDGSVELAWSGANPEVIAVSPPPDAFAVPASDATDTIDRLTAFWVVVRGTSEDALCDQDLDVYDGARLSRFALSEPRIDGTQATCDGLYQRRAGYPPEDMEERTDFPFTATYALEEGRWALTDVRATSLFGQIRVRITRE